MKFNKGTSSFFSSTLLEEGQHAQIFGAKGKIEFELPFNPSITAPSKIILHRNSKSEEIIFETCNQYTIQADLFSLAIINDTEVPTPLIDAVNNIKVIEDIIESDKLRGWVTS
jgi:predicted dehydrogenase